MATEMLIHESWTVDEHYTIARVERYPDALYQSLFDRYMMPGHPILPWRAELTGAEKEKFEALNARLKGKYWLRLALLHDGELVGWSYGWQDSVHAGDFYMAGSLVLPDHRGKGLYSKLVNRVLEITRADGLSAVRSRHICTNNAVLIAKLKLGFVINGFEQDETMGTLVRTIFHHNDLRRNATFFRAGKLDEPSVLGSLRSDNAPAPH